MWSRLCTLVCTLQPGLVQPLAEAEYINTFSHYFQMTSYWILWFILFLQTQNIVGEPLILNGPQARWLSPRGQSPSINTSATAVKPESTASSNSLLRLSAANETAVLAGQSAIGRGKSGKFLNLITWVRFTNEECAANTGDNGTCFTSGECTDFGGKAAGTCASGFGVCCVLQVRFTHLLYCSSCIL